MLTRIAHKAKSKALHTIFFLPPFAPSVNEAMIKSGKYLGYSENNWKSIVISAEPSMEFFDFTALASADNEYLDGFHGGDAVYSRIAQQLTRNQKIADYN